MNRRSGGVPALRFAVQRAAVLTTLDAYEQAAQILARHLAALDPVTADPGHDLIAAAILYVRVVDPTRASIPDVVAWARYAYRASRTTHGVYHPQTVQAAETLILVLHSRGDVGEALELRRDLIQAHLDHGDVAAHLVARMELAAQLHDAGRCGDAIRHASTAWQTWIARLGPVDGRGRRLVTQLVAMLHACARLDEARWLIEQAGPLYPAGADPTHADADPVLRRLGTMRTNHQHRCARHLDVILEDHIAAPLHPADRAARWEDLFP